VRAINLPFGGKQFEMAFSYNAMPKLKALDGFIMIELP